MAYLRLSATPRCSMRCVYCRPSEECAGAANSLLTPLEIETLVRWLVECHGLRKVRLTGGEPTTRPDLLDIIGRMACVDGWRELALITNGLTLARNRGRSIGTACWLRVRDGVVAGMVLLETASVGVRMRWR